MEGGQLAFYLFIYFLNFSVFSFRFASSENEFRVGSNLNC